MAIEDPSRSSSVLDIWITSVGDPCGIAPHPADEPGYVWEVAIYECSGQVLRWCGREYAYLQAPCGHLMVEVPPGRYMVRACVAMHPGAEGPAGNDWTDTAVTVVGCGETECVFLFSPTPHWCGFGFLWALRTLVDRGLVAEERARPAIEAIEGVLEELPPSDFDRTAFQSLVEQREHALKGANGGG